MVEESIARKKKTSDANLFLVPFDRYNLSESMPLGTVCFEFLSCEMNHVTQLLKKIGYFEYVIQRSSFKVEKLSLFSQNDKKTQCHFESQNSIVLSHFMNQNCPVSLNHVN